MSLTVTVNTWYQRWIGQRNLIGQVLRKVRRFYLGTFRPDYVQKAIADTRSGECHRCGLCCELIYKCPFLGKDSQNLPYCRVYGDLRPANCRNYPFDSKDSEIDQCGYSFKPTVDKARPKYAQERQATLPSPNVQSSMQNLSPTSAVFQGKN